MNDTTINFAQIRKLITKALKEAENEALEHGVDVTSVDFKKALREIRDALLERIGVSVESYETYLAELKEIGKTKAEAKRQELDARFDNLKAEIEGKIPEIPAIPTPTYEGLPDKPTLLTREEVARMIEQALQTLPKPKGTM